MEHACSKFQEYIQELQEEKMENQSTNTILISSIQQSYKLSMAEKIFLKSLKEELDETLPATTWQHWNNINKADTISKASGHQAGHKK
ncbi:hypothetical protein TI04_09875 [Achromatium sp. WMS2]|nr:hypothetical protein TI04_09875 [Achromatium sp. WMS2]